MIFGAALVDVLVTLESMIIEALPFGDVTLLKSLLVDAEAVDEIIINNKIIAADTKVIGCIFVLVFIYLLRYLSVIDDFFPKLVIWKFI